MKGIAAGDTLRVYAEGVCKSARAAASIDVVDASVGAFSMSFPA